jgi:hypothetical protein
MLISAPGTPTAEPGQDRSIARVETVAFAAVPRLNTGRIFSDVFLVDPGKPVSDLLKVNVGTIQHNQQPGGGRNGQCQRHATRHHGQRCIGSGSV